MPPIRRAVVTAGGTREAIDDVRAITNASTGRLGVAIARALANHGLEVHLIASREALLRASDLPDLIETTPFSGIDSLEEALKQAARKPTDLVWMAAAVSDYTPVKVSGKIRSDSDTLQIDLTRTRKLLDTLRNSFGERATLIGFKLLSGVSIDELIDAARRQRTRAQLDAVIANDAQRFSEAHHPVLWVGEDLVQPFDGPREDVAAQLVTHALAGTIATPDWGEALDWPAHDRARCWRWLPGAWATDPVQTVPASSDLLAVWEDWCARQRHTIDRPVLFQAHAGVALGASEADFMRNKPAWEALAARGAHALLADGQIVAGFKRQKPDILELFTVDTSSHAFWPQQLGPLLQHQRLVLHDGHALFAQNGFLHSEEGVIAPWHRTDTHTAASALLFHLPSMRVLLGRRKTGIDGIAFPGGRTEAHETAEQTARRELLEETGLHAPSCPPIASWTVWTQADPCWEITACAWPVASLQTPEATAELEARWWPIHEALHEPRLLPGVRHVLQSLVHKLDTLHASDLR